MNPVDYAIKHHLPPVQAAEECGMTETSFRRYTLSTGNKRSPSPLSRRVAQLLDFIRDQGLEPPPSDL